MTDVLYFAYGDNLHPEEIAGRCRQVEKIAAARLRDHALGFFGHSLRWDGGEVSALRQPGADLWGVVYRLSVPAFDRLDAWQGAKLDGTGRYFHCPAEVAGEDGTPYSAIMYKRSTLRDPAPPSREYLSFLAEGAEITDLPAAYIRSLKAIPSVSAGYAVPQEGPMDRFLASRPLDAPCAC